MLHGENNLCTQYLTHSVCDTAGAVGPSRVDTFPWSHPETTFQVCKLKITDF